jgi:hypothetical protein
MAKEPSIDEILESLDRLLKEDAGKSGGVKPEEPIIAGPSAGKSRNEEALLPGTAPSLPIDEPSDAAAVPSRAPKIKQLRKREKTSPVAKEAAPKQAREGRDESQVAAPDPAPVEKATPVVNTPVAASKDEPPASSPGSALFPEAPEEVDSLPARQRVILTEDMLVHNPQVRLPLGEEDAGDKMEKDEGSGHSGADLDDIVQRVSREVAGRLAEALPELVAEAVRKHLDSQTPDGK